MTPKETIKNLKKLKSFHNGSYGIAINHAIKALEQQPSNDCISREEALKIMCDKCPMYNCVTGCSSYRHIEKMPSVTPKQTRWIPVSERLPEEGICDDGYVEPSDYVLVWGDHGNYGVSRYWGNRKTKTENPNSYKDWMDLEWVVQKPIAWMPLPEGYKAESEDKE